jgi:hypothetical protein
MISVLPGYRRLWQKDSRGCRNAGSAGGGFIIVMIFGRYPEVFIIISLSKGKV